MRSAWLGLLISALVGAEDSSDEVVVLTESSFDDFVEENKYVLAEFYAPWCGHCKALKPEYAKAAASLKASGSAVKLAMIDATEEKDLAAKFEVRGYPTLFWFENGKKSEYDGGRTSSDIVEWVTEASQPAVKTSTAPSAPASSKKPLVVLTGPAAAAPSAFQSLAEGSRKKGDFFYQADSAASEYRLTVQHLGEEKQSKSFVSEALTGASEFFAAFEFPLFGELNGQSYSRYMERERGLVWVLPEVKKTEDFAKNVEELRATGVALAKKLPEYSVVYIDTLQFKSAVENMLGVSVFPAVALHLEAGSKKKFVYPLAEGEKITADAVAEWVKKAESGEVKPNYKSEPIPEKNDSPVKTVVGANLKEMVFDQEKDVLLAITATWCGHCKKMKPEYEKLAKKINKEGLDKVLTIANMDGTLNDSPVEEISWQGFPTIFYVKAGTKDVIAYEGGRDAKAFWKWLKNNHSKKELFAKEKDENKKEETTKKTDNKEEL